MPCTHRILVPQPGIEPLLLALKVQILNCWTAGKSLPSLEHCKRQSQNNLKVDGIKMHLPKCKR